MPSHPLSTCLASALLLGAALSQPVSGQPALRSGLAPDLIIVNAILLSPERDAPLEDAWVRVSGDRIIETGSGPIDVGAARIIDAGQGFLIPGLIDSHVHLYHATGLRRRYSEDYEALYQDYMAQQPRSFLFHGFTTVIELNADAATNARFEAAPLHPHLVHCGQGVVLSDGFMALELGGEPVWDTYPGYLIDTHAAGLVPEGADIAAHTPEAAVASVLDQGGQCIKLYYEEALWWPGGAPAFRLPSVDIVRDVVRAAHAENLPVLLHATTPAGHAFALEAGVDILAHGLWEWTDQSFTDPQPSAEIESIARRISHSPIAVQPTVQTLRNTASLFDATLLEDRGWTDVVPAAYLGYLRGDAQAQRQHFIGMFGQMIAEGDEATDMAAAQSAFLNRYEDLIWEMSTEQARFLFGSDTAVGGFGWASPPGLAGYWEMQNWIEAGISPATLFRSLTIDNAVAFGLAGEIGTIEAGKRADLLILRANPLLDVTAYDRIDMVLLAGQPLERSVLSARQSEAAR
ncbi:amidohydrolase family protein [Maricaulis salignorans]|uniref:amidohydrolase family protein n=1 Tax=Maricaulis salignorans TaxID=144026 RepID=UPI0015A247F8|nr:amidohydrolase family protein [Maricaulis salignorans]